MIKNTIHLTHAYVHRLADVHLAGFAPAFTLSLCDSEYARKPPVPIASVVSTHPKKTKTEAYNKKMNYFKYQFMKKKLTIILILFPFVLFAQQIKLTADLNAYRAADQITKQQVEFKDPGSKGRNLTWDFRLIQPTTEEDYTLDYFIPDSTRMNRLCGMEHNTRYYYTQQNDSLWATGFENSTTYMKYVTPELRLKFPLSYGDTLFSYFRGEGEHCHRDSLHVRGYTKVIVDAEGELQLPNFETIKKALRVRTTRHYTEVGKDSVEMTLDTYSWYAEGIRYPVFESVKTSLSKKGDSKDELGESMTDTTVFSTSFYYPPGLQITQVETVPLPVETDEELLGAAAVFTEAILLPNPVVENLNLNFKLTRNARVWFSVHSNGGLPLCQTPQQNLSEGYNSSTINMGSLMTGTYTLYVHVDDMVMQKIVVKK